MYFVEKINVIVRFIMEQEQNLQLDENLKKDIKDCQRKAELLEKVLTMIVKGFAPEY